MSWPEAIGARSTSIGAPAAIVEASGFIWEMNGQSVATPPTAAPAPDATKGKSRRTGRSAETAVVPNPNPFSAAARAALPGKPPTNLQAPPTPLRRRARMDYLDQVTNTRHDSWSKFERWRNDKGYRLILLTHRGVSS